MLQPLPYLVTSMNLLTPLSYTNTSGMKIFAGMAEYTLEISYLG